MPKLRVHNLAISADGYAAGPGQDVDNPLGLGGATCSATDGAGARQV
jgi:hypothetical protein